MEVKKEEKCESDAEKRSRLTTEQIKADAEKDYSIRNETKEQHDERLGLKTGDVSIDIHCIAFIVKVIRMYHEQWLHSVHGIAVLPPAQTKACVVSEQRVMDMLVKFFEENKGKPFSDFTVKTPKKEGTCDNMVVQ